MSKDEEFARGMAAVRSLYGSIWDRELAFAASWAEDVEYDDDNGASEVDGQSLCFHKDGSKYWFLVGDGQWDADDPRGEMIEALLAERVKDGEALAVAKVALDAAEAKLREVIAERDKAKQATRDAWAARHHALDLASDRGVKLEILTAERDAAICEADRLRHGVPIEGDFVCPDSLALTEAMKVIEAVRTLGEVGTQGAMAAVYEAVATFGLWERGERKAGGK